MKKEMSIARENSQMKEKTPKEIRREERHREREESSEVRKRDKDKERRRDKKVTTAPVAVIEDEPGYYNYYDEREEQRDRDRQQRDLSSVSNSSHGSPHRQEVVAENERGESIERVPSELD